MCGIFAYLNYSTPKSRQFILETLVNGLKRLEYRGYDSAGIAFDSDNDNDTTTEVVKSRGKVQELSAKIFASSNPNSDIDYEREVKYHLICLFRPLDNWQRWYEMVLIQIFLKRIVD